MDTERTSRLGLAVGISLGLHVLVLLAAEVGSSGDQVVQKVPAPPVEISRVSADGTTLPAGNGESSFNSPSSVASPGFGQKYDLDAGVPTRIPIPPNQPKAASTTTTPPIDQSPILSTPTGVAPERHDPPRRQQEPSPQNEFTPPLNQQGNMEGQSPPSAASRPSTAGNLGKPRSRGPNRVAFPEYTVEPRVPSSMISGTIVNSVDVNVEIAADGSHTVRIVRSSGSSEVDALVLDALKQWRWDPAAREGTPIASTQNFMFKFKPR